MALTKKGLVRKAAAKKSRGDQKDSGDQEEDQEEDRDSQCEGGRREDRQDGGQEDHGEDDLGKENRGSHAIESNRQENDCEEEGGQENREQIPLAPHPLAPPGASPSKRRARGRGQRAALGCGGSSDRDDARSPSVIAAAQAAGTPGACATSRRVARAAFDPLPARRLERSIPSTSFAVSSVLKSIDPHNDRPGAGFAFPWACPTLPCWIVPLSTPSRIQRATTRSRRSRQAVSEHSAWRSAHMVVPSPDPPVPRGPRMADLDRS